jgi:SAM-dependent methyltransferase
VKLDNPLVVQWEYASEERLAARNHAYRQLVEGANAEEMAYDAVAEASPKTVLEVGCGMGEVAERIQKDLRADVRALDISERMVDLTRERGVRAEVGDVQSLAFADGEFDCVVANWVLYHVPDVDRAVREIARVLKPDGRLVAATLGTDHMVELWEMLGGAPTSGLSFDHDTGGAALAPHFATVDRRVANGTVVFPDSEAIRSFVAATTDRSHLATNVPEVDKPFRTRSAHSVFVADKKK